LPDGFTVHPRVKPVLEKRREMAYEGKIDWAFAELLALGSLVSEGKLVRLSGQDTQRGTFTQRHAVIVDRKTGEEFTPLQLLATTTDGTPTGGRFLVYNSALSEYAAVGFEYGYSVGNPDAMVLWEAQFGDFVNGAQSIIDEFISSGEAKWGQLSNVVLLLPHGHEGQGPDHTSGRIERFLQLWAEGSMTIAVPSTPANYFHLLRRHGLDGIQRPLIVFTPKSMLRNKAAVSDIRDFTEQKFRSVLEEPTYTDGDGDRTKVTRILLCSGKIYYDLAARKVKDKRDDVAIVRLEQLAPLPKRRLAQTLDNYPNATDKYWVQEEPANQGAWPSVGLTLPEVLPEYFNPIKRISRRAMSAPSSGSTKVHAVEQQEILDLAFAPTSSSG
jgi:2-oxoglutarate decarboxylase